MRIGAGLAAPAFLLAVTFGSVAVDSGWGRAAPVVASIAVFSGSAQFTLVTALAGGTAWAAVVSATLMNLRFLPMALAVAPALRGGRLRRGTGSTVGGRRILGGRPSGRGTLRPRPAHRGHVGPVARLGRGDRARVVLSPPSDLTHTLALDVVFPAFFVVLLLEEMRASTRARVAGVTGGLLTAVLLLFLPAGPALLGGSVAALLGLFGQRPQEQA
jgi:predicted branched-subunit amino acid permease